MKSSRKGSFDGEQMKGACHYGASGRSSTGTLGARWLLGLTRGNGIDQHERLGQIGGGKRWHGHGARHIGEGQDAAACGANPTLVGCIRQLGLSLVCGWVSISLRRRVDRLYVVVVLNGRSGVIIGLLRILRCHVSPHCLVRRPRTAIEHRCRSKALQRQSQHYQAQQKAANTRHGWDSNDRFKFSGDRPFKTFKLRVHNRDA